MKAKPMRFALSLWIGSSLLVSGGTIQQAASFMLFDLYSRNGAYNAEFPANHTYLWMLTNDSRSTDSDESSTPTAKHDAYDGLLFGGKKPVNRAMPTGNCPKCSLALEW